MSAIIDLGEWKLKRFSERKHKDDCKHTNMALIHDGGYVLCEDCQAKLSAFYVLEMLSDKLILELHRARGKK